MLPNGNTLQCVYSVATAMQHASIHDLKSIELENSVFYNGLKSVPFSYKKKNEISIFYDKVCKSQHPKKYAVVFIPIDTSLPI